MKTTIKIVVFFILICRCSADQIKISFTDNSVNEEKFNIERKVEGKETDFKIIGSVISEDPKQKGVRVFFLDTDVSLGNIYIYRVNAGNEWGISQYTNELRVALMGPPEAPTNVQYTQIPEKIISSDGRSNNNEK